MSKPPPPAEKEKEQQKTTPPPLPYELWLRILESLSHAHLLARPAYVNCFVKAIIRGRATEQDLVPALPEFERRAWKATRPYYAINGEIRKAAQQVFLSGVLLQSCRPPLEEVPRKRKGRRRARGCKGVGMGRSRFGRRMCWRG